MLPHPRARMIVVGEASGRLFSRSRGEKSVGATLPFLSGLENNAARRGVRRCVRLFFFPFPPLSDAKIREFRMPRRPPPVARPRLVDSDSLFPFSPCSRALYITPQVWAWRRGRRRKTWSSAPSFSLPIFSHREGERVFFWHIDRSRSPMRTLPLPLPFFLFYSRDE